MNGRQHHEGGFRGGPRSENTAPFQRRGDGRRRRGDVRAALLVALLEGPGHGYQLIQTLSDRSGGMWRPSPGAVYPSLEALLDEGMVSAETTDGRRVFTLTDEGRVTAEQRQAAGALPGTAGESPNARGRLRDEVHALVGAAKQVGSTGSPEVIDRATKIVNDARKALYGLLADA